MELRSLRHFSALAETLNYRVAAERLHLTQPALTRSIAALERELGVQLFDRDKRHVALTADGAELLERASEVLADADQLAAAAGAIRARRRDEVRIALYGVALAELTHPVIEAFCERYPRATIRVHEVDFHQGLAPLLADEYDVALLPLNIDMPGLTRVPIFTEPLSLALWKGHPLAGAAAVDVTEVFDQPWVTPAPGLDFWVGGRNGDDDAPTVGFHARSALDVSLKIAYQHMVGLMPLSATRMFPHPGVENVAPKEPLGLVAAVVFPEASHSPAAPAFAELARRVARRATGVPYAEISR
ncbi:LysR family transcriptional regulator [Streptomyces sp. NPDC002144]